MNLFGDFSPLWGSGRQVATVSDLTNNIQVNNKFGTNIQQRQIQNILGPTVNGDLILTPTNQFFDHASKICVLKQGVPNGLI